MLNFSLSYRCSHQRIISFSPKHKKTTQSNKVHSYNYANLIITALIIFVTACTEENLYDWSQNAEYNIINLCGNIQQEYETRANDSGFAQGDCMGIYIVDYEKDLPGTLSDYDNRANNTMYELKSSKWTPLTPIYWKDEVTPIDIYGYYPYDDGFGSIHEHQFSVESDQSALDNNGMSGYEKSDFLWAKVTKASPTSEPIQLKFTHQMAGIKVELTQGSGFGNNEWENIKKRITIENLISQALIDLSSGEVLTDGNVRKPIIMIEQSDCSYRAVIVPQTIEAGIKLLNISFDDKTYSYAQPSSVDFQSGKLHKYNIKVDKISTGDYKLSLTNKEITPWENDMVTHNFNAMSYTMIDCPKEGTLKQCINKAGLNSHEIKNLKIRGRINSDDYEFIREETPALMYLDLSDVVSLSYVVREEDDFESFKEGSNDYLNKYLKPNQINENVMPYKALYEKQLEGLILPKDLVMIDKWACGKMYLPEYSTLILPETIKILRWSSLYEVSHGTIVLPKNIEFIGNFVFGESGSSYCTIVWTLGNSTRHIGKDAFSGIKSSGTFRVPDNIEHIGEGAFSMITGDIKGDYTIPSNLKSIPKELYSNTSFTGGGSLQLHEGIISIGENAFARTTINSYITFPKSLTRIGRGAFAWSVLRGGISELPSGLIEIGDYAFTGIKNMPSKIEIPSLVTDIKERTFAYSDVQNMKLSSVETIGESAFAGCDKLENLEIGKNLYFIDQYAFLSCLSLKLIVCLASDPPAIEQNAFANCDFEHIILEVPENSIGKYQNADGWNQFKYITPHHELAASVSEITCLDKGISRELIIRSEGAWEVLSVPQWCKITPSEGENRRTECTVNIAKSESSRNGEIILRLKDSGYTTSIAIEQYVMDVNEDTEIVLQESSKQENGIPIIIVGDGFTAREIADGKYLESVQRVSDYLFDVEPFKTYKEYFSVRTALACSVESGINTASSLVNNKFGTIYAANRCNRVSCRPISIEKEKIEEYVNAVFASLGTHKEKAQIIVVSNTDIFDGFAECHENGSSLSVVTLCDGEYPYDARGIVQHYAGGCAFGRLAPEYSQHNEYIQACSCSCCNALPDYYYGKSMGWYGNIAIGSTPSFTPWDHLITDSRYGDIVDIYEGGYFHTYGVVRSEPQSCMSTYIPYFNTISRELIVRHIKELSGELFSFEEFVSRDSREGKP